MLKAVPDSIEAVNNKAWILHTYLGKSREALELALGLQKRAVPAALPCEFFDTLGAIQESVGQTRDAEASYLEGLKKDPKNPALNFHYGKLLTRPTAAAPPRPDSYLARALADRGRLSPTMAREADDLAGSASAAAIEAPTERGPYDERRPALVPGLDPAPGRAIGLRAVRSRRCDLCEEPIASGTTSTACAAGLLESA